MSVDVEIKVEGEKIVLRIPYDPCFVEKLKKTFLDDEREYDSERRLWYISYSDENYAILERLVNEHFFGVQEYLAVFLCNGAAPRINGTTVIKFSRDFDEKRRSWCFEVIDYIRTGSHGSRRYPLFYGVVLAKIKTNENTEIVAEKYELFPYTKTLHVFAVNVFKGLKAESLSEQEMYNKLVEELRKESQKISGFTTPSEEAVVVKGFLVISSLPSKALLDAAFPEWFKDTRVGTKFIKIVSGYFYNKLGSLSRKFYNQILKKYGVWSGFGYIIPPHKVGQFWLEVQKLKREYEVFEKQLREFIEYGRIPENVHKLAKIDAEYLDIVKEYLEQQGIKEIRIPEIANRVKIRLVRLRLDLDEVQDMLDEKVAREIRNQMYKVRQEIVEEMREDLEERVNSIIERLKEFGKTRITKKALRKMKEDLEDIKKTAEELGVDVSYRVSKLIESISIAEEVAEGKAEVEVAEEVDGRLKALLKELG